MKKVICAMILFSLCFALAACGKKEQNSIVIETATEATETKETAEATTEATTAETTQAAAATEAETDGQIEIVGVLGVRSEVKEVIDNYEAAIDIYVDLVKKYSADPTNTQVLTEISERTPEIMELMQSFSTLDRTGMTVEEINYLNEVSDRVNKKMKDAGLG